MATDLRQQPKLAPASKYEQLVEEQLARARGRIRRLDILGSILALLLGVLAYALVMGIVDKALDLLEAVRVTAFVVFLVALCGYLGLFAFRLANWSVNPYYAARRLEETIPNAKNSLINWLDLRDEPMPPVIRGTLGRKAAKDLGAADLEQAVNGRRALWLAGSVGGLVLVLLVWCLMGPSQFASLLRRAFIPFEKGAIAHHTRIELLQPHGGNLTVGVREPVRIRVKVTGHVPRVNQPDALNLHFRYRQSDPYIVRPLEEDAEGEWLKTLVPDDVQTGFWYKVTGGDAATPEYQVKVRAIPQVTRFEVKYHYPAYLRLPDVQANYGPTEASIRPDLKAPRGTEVTLITRTNRALKTAQLVMRQGAEIRQLFGEPVTGDAEAKQFQFVLDRDGEYHTEFTSVNDESNLDRSSKYTLEAVPDRPPVVKLTKPGKDIELPANGTLSLEGAAWDDHGLKGMTLRLRLKKDPPAPDLEPRPYRPGVSFQLANGAYLKHLIYKDFVALETLKTAKGQPFPLAAGMEVEYWLEAMDNCDYPPDAGGNVGKSLVYLVKITPPVDQKQQEQQRQQAQAEKQKHAQQQDREQQKQNQEAAKEKDRQNETPEQRAKREQQEREQFEQEARQLKDALDEKKRQDESKGGAKGDPRTEPKGGDKQGPQDSKTEAGNKKDEQQPGGAGEAGAKKDEGKGGEKADKGDAKGAGQQQKQQAQQGPGDGKAEGQQNQQAGSQGQAKDDKGAAKEKSPSQPKGPGQQQPQDQVGEGKDQGGKGEKQETAKVKEGGQQSKAGEQPKGGEKTAGGQGQKNEAAKAKGDGQEQGAQQQAHGDNKTGPKQPDQVAQGRGQGDKGKQPEASQQKGPGQSEQRAEQHNQGEVKGPPQQTAEGPKGQPKEGGQQGAGGQPNGHAKGADPKPQQGSGAQAREKQAKPEQAANAGAGKSDRDPKMDRSTDTARNAENATREDVARLEKDLERQGQQQEEAIDELSRIRKEAKDRDVRKAVEDLMKKYGIRPQEDPGQVKDRQDPSKQGTEADAKGLGKEQEGPKKGPPTGTAKEEGQGKQGEIGKGKGSDPGKTETAKGEMKKGGNRPQGGAAGQGAQGREDDPFDPLAVDTAAARRAGELQLENLKKKLKDPGVWKKMGWKDQEDADRFLEQARAYQEWLRQQEKATADNSTRPAVKNVLPSQAVRPVGPSVNQRRDPLELGDAQAPPEFREALRRFTTKPRE